MRLLRFKARFGTIAKLCCALLRTVKLCYALGNFDIADYLYLRLEDMMATRNPELEHDLWCFIYFQLLNKPETKSVMIEWLLGERVSARGSLASATKRHKA